MVGGDRIQRSNCKHIFYLVTSLCRGYFLWEVKAAMASPSIGSDGRGRHETTYGMSVYVHVQVVLGCPTRPKMGRRRGVLRPTWAAPGRARGRGGGWTATSPSAAAERRLLGRGVAVGAGRRSGGEPAREGVEGARVGAVVALREAHEVGPREVRVAARRGHGGRRAHHAVLARAQEEGQRPPLLTPVHHRAVEAALVPPVGQRLHQYRNHE
jgi:hypothetical protein